MHRSDPLSRYFWWQQHRASAQETRRDESTAYLFLGSTVPLPDDSKTAHTLYNEIPEETRTRWIEAGDVAGAIYVYDGLDHARDWWETYTDRAEMLDDWQRMLGGTLPEE